MSTVIRREDLIACFGDTMRVLRLNLGMTQTELADKIGVAFATINRMENGHHCPDATQLFNLAEVLSVPVEQFRPRKKKKKKPA